VVFGAALVAAICGGGINFAFSCSAMAKLGIVNVHSGARKITTHRDIHLGTSNATRLRIKTARKLKSCFKGLSVIDDPDERPFGHAKGHGLFVSCGDPASRRAIVKAFLFGRAPLKTNGPARWGQVREEHSSRRRSLPQCSLHDKQTFELICGQIRRKRCKHLGIHTSGNAR
jgi:hypothetical protein